MQNNKKNYYVKKII